MKTTITMIALSALFSLSAHAEYIVKIPLEASAGGYLPDESISFGEEIEPELTYEEQLAKCNSEASAAISYLQGIGSDAQIRDYRLESFSNPEFTYYSCQIDLYTPIHKGYGCTGNTNYANSVISMLSHIYTGGTNFYEYGTGCN